MHLNQIRLEHFRGATNLVINLDAKLNVFYGNNGAGKSTILDAAALALSRTINRITAHQSSKKTFLETDIQNGQNQSSIAIAGECFQVSFDHQYMKIRNGRFAGAGRSAASIQPSIEKLRSILLNNEHSNVPVLLYYPVNRTVLDIPLKIKTKHDFDVINTYDESLTGAANFRTFFEWFRNREDIENELLKPIRGFDAEQLTQIDWNKYRDSQLQAVRTAICTFMPEFSDLTIRRSPLRMEITKNKETLRVEQLSDGEKCLMAMIGDIARRLVIANPSCDNPLDGDGIILIDEIDLHLHPTWQHMIISQLIKTFRNCQFLISTHSPLVITHIFPVNLFSLAMCSGKLTVEKPHESYGRNVIRILEDLMGLPTTRPDEIEKRIKNIYALIAEWELEKAANKIEELKKLIGDDPEFARAKMLLQRKESISA